MGESLNTTVNGSVGTCTEAADFLGEVYSASTGASSEFHGARGVADATWKGPAHDELSDRANKVTGEIDTVGDRAFKAEWALKDFAGALKAVLTKMDDAIAKAQAGGLPVDGPFIVTPDLPPPAPILPTGACGTAQAAQVMQQNQQAIAAHNQVVNDYNAKVAVYNECKAIVTQARWRATRTTHLIKSWARPARLCRTIRPRSVSPSRPKRAVSSATMENGRRLAADEATRLKTQAAFYENFALGKQADYPEYAKALLERSGNMAEDAGKLNTRAQQFGQWINTMPEDARKALTAYPGSSAAENLSQHSEDPKLPEDAKH